MALDGATKIPRGLLSDAFCGSLLETLHRLVKTFPRKISILPYERTELLDLDSIEFLVRRSRAGFKGLSLISPRRS